MAHTFATPGFSFKPREIRIWRRAPGEDEKAIAMLFLDREGGLYFAHLQNNDDEADYRLEALPFEVAP